MIMNKITYFLLEDNVTINNNGKLYIVNKTDRRFSKVIKVLESNEHTDLDSVLDPTTILNKEDFKVVDGIIFFKDQEVPSILGNEFFNLNLSHSSFVALVNFWFNLKNRVDFDDARDAILSLISKKGYPFTKDGFIMAYEGSSQGELNKKFQTPFYCYTKYSIRNEKLLAMLDNKMLLEEIIEEFFGAATKKLTKIVRALVIRENSDVLDFNVLNYGLVFKGILSLDNIVKILEESKEIKNSLFDYENDVELYSIRLFLKELIETKMGKSEKNLITFLKEIKKTNFSLTRLSGYYARIKANDLNFDLSTLLTNNTPAQIYMELEELASTMGIERKPLTIHKNYKKFLELDGLESDKFKLEIPKSNLDLYKYKRYLNNCIADHGFGDKFNEGKCVLLAVLDKNGIPLYNIEIVDGRVVQFEQKAPKRTVSEEERKPILDILERYKLIKKRK